jgi:hypothetical protein
MSEHLENNVPLYVCDEHNEAFYFWHKARHDGYLKKPLDLFHVDAHDDMGMSSPFSTSLYHDKESRVNYGDYYSAFSEKELHNGNFILPAVLSGMLRNIYFFYPQWRRMKPLRKRMNISSVFGEGKILKYNVKKEKNASPGTVIKALPDLTSFTYSACEIDRVPRRRKVILDIDLDYFACRDTIHNEFSYEMEITREQFLNREKILHDKTLPFSGFEFVFREDSKKFHVEVRPQRVKDESYMPSEKEIVSEIEWLLSTLKVKDTKPAVITMCRSCISGYCPGDVYEFIERSLRERLNKVFPIVNVNAHL